MIERKLLGLKEIGHKKYAALALRYGKKGYKPYIKGTGYAQIVIPLQFQNYTILLKNFIETKYARKASVNLGQVWQQINAADLNSETIKLLVDNAEDTGYLFLSFRCLHSNRLQNNEICFSPLEGMIKSVFLNIPDNEKNLYNWLGSEKKYRRIRGIYVPTAHK
jgi:hypothetical protein